VFILYFSKSLAYVWKDISFKTLLVLLTFKKMLTSSHSGVYAMLRGELLSARSLLKLCEVLLKTVY